jgi:hypothetical protein
MSVCSFERSMRGNLKRDLFAFQEFHQALQFRSFFRF